MTTYCKVLPKILIDPQIINIHTNKEEHKTHDLILDLELFHCLVLLFEKLLSKATFISNYEGLKNLSSVLVLIYIIYTA